MINWGTVVILLVLSAFVGYSIGEDIGYKRYEKHTKELKEYYLDCTRKLVEYIVLMDKNKKDGER